MGLWAVPASASGPLVPSALVSVVGLVQVGITRAGPTCALGLTPSSQSTSRLLGTGPTVGRNSSGNHAPAPDSQTTGSAEVWTNTPPSPVSSTTHEDGAPRSNHPLTTRAQSGPNHTHHEGADGKPKNS